MVSFMFSIFYDNKKIMKKVRPGFLAAQCRLPRGRASGLKFNRMAQLGRTGVLLPALGFELTPQQTYTALGTASQCRGVSGRRG